MLNFNAASATGLQFKHNVLANSSLSCFIHVFFAAILFQCVKKIVVYCQNSTSYRLGLIAINCSIFSLVTVTLSDPRLQKRCDCGQISCFCQKVQIYSCYSHKSCSSFFFFDNFKRFSFPISFFYFFYLTVCLNRR